MQLKVITPVDVEPVSLEEARLQCNMTDSDDMSQDGLLNTWITAAREIAEQYTGHALATQTLEGALDCFPETGDEYIDLLQPPVTSILSIKYTDLSGVEQTVSSGNYSLSSYGDARRVAPSFGHCWPVAQDVMNAVRIRYVAGYPIAPKAAKSAMLLMVAWMNEHRGDEMSENDIQPLAAKALLNTIKIWGR